MTDEDLVEISRKHLKRIHDRNKDLDAEVYRKDQEIELLQKTIERLTRHSLQTIKQVV